MQIQSPANLLQQSSFNQQRDRGVDVKAAEELRKSAWKKLIKQKIKGNIQKRLWDEMGQKRIKNN